MERTWTSDDGLAHPHSTQSRLPANGEAEGPGPRPFPPLFLPLCTLPPPALASLPISVCLLLPPKPNFGNLLWNLVWDSMSYFASLASDFSLMKWDAGTDSFKNTPSSLMMLWVRISIPQNLLTLELWLSRIQVGENVSLLIQHVTDLNFSSVSFNWVQMVRRKMLRCIYKLVTKVTLNS